MVIMNYNKGKMKLTHPDYFETVSEMIARAEKAITRLSSYFWKCNDKLEKKEKIRIGNNIIV
jgi:hypothetical protein